MQIIQLLANGERCACDLIADLNVTQSGLSYQMKILEQSGIVVGRQQGEWRYYCLSEEGVTLVIDRIKALTQFKRGKKV